MKRLFGIATVAVVGFVGCNWDEGPCWFRDQDGLAVDEPTDGCGRPPDKSPCYAQCADKYDKAISDCGWLDTVAEKKSCHEAAYAGYTTCRQACVQGHPCRKACEDIAEVCESNCRAVSADYSYHLNCWWDCENNHARCAGECSD